jgi:hypothetical protein
MLTFEKFFIEFHREFYFWERFEKRVFPTDPLSRTDTFGTHCTSLNKTLNLTVKGNHFRNG